MGPPPRVLRTVAVIRSALAEHRRTGASIGLVPTMGALHDGHRSLIRAARAETDVVVVSIFVNPLQFAPSEDLDAYPRTLDADLAMLADEGVQLVFHPDPSAFTPVGRVTTVHVDRLTAMLEGASRPTHFDGVTTIVTKLLNAVGPDRAYFGEKDFQQQAIIRAMVRDLDIPTVVVTCPVVREPDGLALSSRNVYLSSSERQDALILSRTLRQVVAAWDGDADSARRTLAGTIGGAQGVRLDYAEIIDPVTLEPIEGVHDGTAQAVVAAHVGRTRLIDTMALPARSSDTGPAI